VTTASPLDREPTSRSFFEELYRTDPDPWRFTDDAYEQARYQHLLAHVPAGRYDTAFEPGCSIGVLTRQLADRCRRVFAIDIAEAAVAEAHRRCADRPGVDLARGELPHDLPDEPVDLVVLSEIGYYLTEPVLIDMTRRIRGVLTPGGRVVAVHWTGESSDHVLHGRDVHRILDTHLELDHRFSAEHRHDPMGDLGVEVAATTKGFLLDVWDVPR
jgi:cyclopropane fatty-acyl-phospholipid synthase-like methyltransferase